MSYGTGAIMAVPAHDTRDWEFAKKFNLPIIEVVAGGENVQEKAFTDVATGKMVNSGFLDGLEVAEAKKKIVEWLEEKKVGTGKTNFKLRDWVFSRQRYWGEPIPIVHCDKDAVMYSSLKASFLGASRCGKLYPLYDNGESPLAAMTDWVNTTCPCTAAVLQNVRQIPCLVGWIFLVFPALYRSAQHRSPCKQEKHWITGCRLLKLVQRRNGDNTHP